MYSRECVTHGILAGNTVVKMVGSGPGEGPVGTHLHMGKVHGLHMLPNQELDLLKGILVRSSNEGQ
jgi:hypothetical protein